MDMLEQVTSDMPEMEDFEVYVASRTQQYKVTDLVDGLRLGEFEDEELDEKEYNRHGHGKFTRELQSLEHLRGVWLVRENKAEPLSTTVKKFLEGLESGSPATGEAWK